MNNRANYFLMDVFTEKKFSGNPLAIFPKAEYIPEQFMPLIAKELNISETVFLFSKNKDGHYPMRIFTPGMELPTAGHPTIGTAIFLSREIKHDTNRPLEITLNQKIGQVKTKVYFNNNLPYFAEMKQLLPQFGPIYENRDQFAELINLHETDLMDYPIQEVSCGVKYIFIPVKKLLSIQSIQFRMDIWNSIKSQLSGAFIYAFCPEAQDKGNDVHGRMFAPDAGILEDPATGSANGPLGCYLIYYRLKKSPMKSEQGYEMGRPSLIHIDIDVEKEQNIIKVGIGGSSVFVGSGSILLD